MEKSEVPPGLLRLLNGAATSKAAGFIALHSKDSEVTFLYFR